MTYEYDESQCIKLAAQGCFAVGGKVIETTGPFDPHVFVSPTGNTFHADHAYVQYQLPVNRRRLPLVMWHGGGQFSKTWETTPDGREGFQTIFVRRGWPVYILDQAGRGRAGNRSEGRVIEPRASDRSLWIVFRLGIWPERFPGVQFPEGDKPIEQYWRQTTPDTGLEERHIEVDPVLALFQQLGQGVLLTHSASGQYGWFTGMRSENVRAIVSYEPARFVYPDDEAPDPVPAEDEFVARYTKPILVPSADFDALTHIPIQIVFGDNVPSAPSPYPGLDFWRVVTRRAEQFADAVNRRGGDLSILRLPDVGIHGNTHFPFSDLNNVAVGDLLSAYLREKGLDGR
jgi:hypothetical protein